MIELIQDYLLPSLILINAIHFLSFKDKVGQSHIADRLFGALLVFIFVAYTQ